MISRLAETKIELHVEFGGAIFSLELVHCIDFTVSRSGELLSRAPARTFHVATPLCLRLSCRLVPTSGAQISRFLPACLRRKQAHQPSCPSPNGRRRLWQVQVSLGPRSVWFGRSPSHAAHSCLRAAGPRAILLRAADDPGLIGHLLFVNFLIMPVALLAHLVCRVKVSELVSWSSRIVTVNEWW